jgi:serine/threonine protein kinase
MKSAKGAPNDLRAELLPMLTGLPFNTPVVNVFDQRRILGPAVQGFAGYARTYQPQQGAIQMVMPSFDGDLSKLWAQIGDPLELRDGDYAFKPEFKRSLTMLSYGLWKFHAAGYIHRDLKEENVFFKHGPDGLVVAIGDYGLSAEKRPGDVLYSDVMGTPGYIHPEAYGRHVHGRAERASVAQDWFALGVMLVNQLAAHPTYVHTARGAQRPGMPGQLVADKSSRMHLPMLLRMLDAAVRAGQGFTLNAPPPYGMPNVNPQKIRQLIKDNCSEGRLSPFGKKVQRFLCLLLDGGLYGNPGLLATTPEQHPVMKNLLHDRSDLDEDGILRSWDAAMGATPAGLCTLQSSSSL